MNGMLSTCGIFTSHVLFQEENYNHFIGTRSNKNNQNITKNERNIYSQYQT